jgi:endonuclease/exonuclease/phosphatase family metal-dependent hydrolase
MKKFLKILRITLKTLLIIIIVVVAAFAGFLIFNTIRDFTPAAVTDVEVVKTTQRSDVFKNEFSFITWNIGYCGLSKNMDFFYDGGTKVRPGEEDYQACLNGVFNFLARHDSVDFFLLQELDKDAHRSYNMNQIDVFKDGLPNHAYSFALNYKVDFVPMPVTNPMADVESGIATFSRFVPTSAKRYSYPLNYAWPMKLFMLDRCFVLERFKLANGKELVLVNLHNSAFDNADLLRRYELWMLRGFLMDEYEKGNYVIAGGDWNQSPPNYDSLRFYSSYYKKPNASKIEKDYLPPNWHFDYDPHYPTNREVYEAYRPGYTPTTILDFFVTSPNLEVEAVNVISTGFEFSDHQPVYLKIRLIEDPLKLYPGECSRMIQNLQDSIQFLNDKMDKKKKGEDKPEKKPDHFYQRK